MFVRVKSVRSTPVYVTISDGDAPRGYIADLADALSYNLSERDRASLAAMLLRDVRDTVAEGSQDFTHINRVLDDFINREVT